MNKRVYFDFSKINPNDDFHGTLAQNILSNLKKEADIACLFSEDFSLHKYSEQSFTSYIREDIEQYATYVDVMPLLGGYDVYGDLKSRGIEIISILDNEAVSYILSQRIVNRESIESKLLSILRADLLIFTSRWAEKEILPYVQKFKSHASTLVIRPKYSEFSSKEHKFLSINRGIVRNIRNNTPKIDDYSLFPHAAQLKEVMTAKNKIGFKHEIIDELCNYAPPTYPLDKEWRNFTERLLEVARNMNRPKASEYRALYQHVIITIRPLDLARCISTTNDKSRLVKNYLVLTRGDLIEDMRKLVDTTKDILFVDEAEIIPSYIYKKFSSLSHAKKNWMLRKYLIQSKLVEDVFIMLDDDNIPLKTIRSDYFINRDGVYNAYYFDELYNWKGVDTSYDQAQAGNLTLLRRDNAELTMYSSHMPQIINKAIFKEMVKYYEHLNLPYIIDEWSTYFNYAISRYPLLFNKKRYEVLGWPAHPNDWLPKYIPNRYVYKNYYDEVFKSKTILDSINDSNNNFSSYKNTVVLTNIVNTWLYRQEKHDHSPTYSNENISVCIENLKKVYAATPDVFLYERLRIVVSVNSKNEQYALRFKSAYDECLWQLTSGTHDIRLPLHFVDWGLSNMSIELIHGDEMKDIGKIYLLGTDDEKIERDLHTLELLGGENE